MDMGKELNEKETKALLDKGGCPARNTRCKYLVDGYCKCENPVLCDDDGFIGAGCTR